MINTKKNLIESWIEKGKRDLITAQNLLKDHGFRDIICYHAQQAAEKFLKTYFIWLDLIFPKTHDLENLIELLSEKDPFVEKWKERAVLLSSYAVEIRYPGFEIPNLEDTADAVSFANEVHDYLILVIDKTL